MHLLSLFIALACLALFSCAEEISLSVDGVTSSGIYCRNVIFSNINDNTGGEKYLRQFHGNRTDTSVNVRSVELWSCRGLSGYEERDTYECSSELPDREACKLAYRWSPTADEAMILPKKAAFFSGGSGEMNNLVLVAHYTAAPGAGKAAAITITFNDEKPEEEAAIMTVGVKRGSTTLKPGLTETEIANNCENSCAFLGDWWVFSASPLMHEFGRSIQTALFDNGLLRRYMVRNQDYQSSIDSSAVFSAEPTDAKASNESMKIGRDDRITVECVYDTTEATEVINGGNTYSTTEACYTYLNYYPKFFGIQSCLNGECVNRSGDSDYFTNVIANYVALSIASMLIGIIIGIALHIVIGMISAWFNANAGRFTLDNLKSFKWVNPMWWYRPYEDDDEDEEKEKLVNAESDEEQITIPTDNI